MSVPQDKLMELMRGSRSAGGGSPSGVNMINIGMAMDLLEQSLPALGSESEEGQKVLGAIRTMTGVLGPRKNKTNELQQSEILQMLQTLPQAGGATPEGKAMAQAPIPGMPPQGGAPTPPPM